MRESLSTVVIGGGASGIAAAISAKRKGRSVVICERMGQIGKKILASGNGRCNLTNTNLNESFYNQSSRQLVRSVFTKFGKEEIDSFFKELGLETYSEDGRIFPITNQSTTVLKALEMELKRLSIPVELNFDVVTISDAGGAFLISSKDNKKLSGDTVVLAGGGKSYPALGSDGNAHKLAEAFGHTIVEPVPIGVPIVVKDPLCHLLQGQKILAKTKSIVDGKVACEAEGDLLFTKYGLSGHSIIDLSESISIAINRDRKKDVFVEIDMVPFMSKEELKTELEKRKGKGFSQDEILVGILPNKFSRALKELSSLKERRFKVIGTRGWNEAYITAGGVDISEVNVNLESKLKKSLYLAGEMLDVNGRRGGYSLAWAWASGFVAGLTL